MTQAEILIRLEELKFNCFNPDTYFEIQDLINDIKGEPISSGREDLPTFLKSILNDYAVSGNDLI